jgi:hypothetical protein
MQAPPRDFPMFPLIDFSVGSNLPEVFLSHNVQKAIVVKISGVKRK